MQLTATKATWRDYLALTKPRIIELLLVTTLPTMMFAAGGWPDLTLALATFVGGSLAAAGANVLNCYIDADIDALMPRTAHRATATGLISHRNVVMFGLSLSLASIVILNIFTNSLAASLAALAIIFYVGVYSLLLKRRTAQNIVWGGIAGCFPVVIGWSAITGSLSVESLLLFLVVFFWTPPHYWPLSIKFRDEYAAADVPMLPVVASDVTVTKNILAYSWVMVACSTALGFYTNFAYWIINAFASGWFLLEAHRLHAAVRSGESAALRAMRLFHLSITYLSLIFLAVGIDSLIR
jgi:protoheme IX farnesyltransferase